MLQRLITCFLLVMHQIPLSVALLLPLVASSGGGDADWFRFCWGVASTNAGGGAKIMSFVSLMDVENPSRVVRFPMNYASGIKSHCRLYITERSTPPSTAFVLVVPSCCLWPHLPVPLGSAELRCGLLIFIYHLHAKRSGAWLWARLHWLASARIGTVWFVGVGSLYLWRVLL